VISNAAGSSLCASRRFSTASSYDDGSRVPIISLSHVYTYIITIIIIIIIIMIIIIINIIIIIIIMDVDIPSNMLHACR